MKRFLSCIAFVSAWIASDAWFNGYLLRQPGFGGRYAHYIEHLHFVAYGALGIFVAWRKSEFLFLASLVWCFLDEYAQNFLPNRVFSWLDIFRNVIGFLAGFLIIYFVREWKDRLKEKNADRRNPP